MASCARPFPQSAAPNLVLVHVHNMETCVRLQPVMLGFTQLDHVIMMSEDKLPPTNLQNCPKSARTRAPEACKVGYANSLCAAHQLFPCLISQPPDLAQLRIGFIDTSNSLHWCRGAWMCISAHLQCYALHAMLPASIQSFFACTKRAVPTCQLFCKK